MKDIYNNLSNTELKELIKQLYKNKSQKEIASDLEISQARVSQLFKKFKIPISKLTLIQDKIIKLYISGYSCYKIAKIYNVNAASINYYINKNGLNTKKDLYKLLDKNGFKKTAQTCKKNGLRFS